MQAVIVPLSAFQSAQEYAWFVEALRTWVRQPLTELTADFSQTSSY